MPAEAEYYLHARILEHLGKQLMIDMIFDMILGYEDTSKDNLNQGPKDLADFSTWLNRYVKKLCAKAPGDTKLYYDRIMRAAREKDFSDFSPPQKHPQASCPTPICQRPL